MKAALTLCIVVVLVGCNPAPTNPPAAPKAAAAPHIVDPYKTARPIVDPYKQPGAREAFAPKEDPVVKAVREEGEATRRAVIEEGRRQDRRQQDKELFGQ